MQNEGQLASEQHDLHDKNSEVCIKTRSPATLLPTVKWQAISTFLRLTVTKTCFKGVMVACGCKLCFEQHGPAF